MKRLLPLIFIAGCASQPPAELYELNKRVNHMASYENVTGYQTRLLHTGGKGNCTLFAFTKYALAVDPEGRLLTCNLKDGNGHMFFYSKGWVLDNRQDQLMTLEEVGCATEPKGPDAR